MAETKCNECGSTTDEPELCAYCGLAGCEACNPLHESDCDQNPDNAEEDL